DGMKFVPMAFNHKDAQWLEGRQFSREEVAAWFNLPPHFLGAMENATFSNIEHQSLDYLNRSLMRWLVKWQEECGEKLLTETAKAADSHFFEFNTAALLRGDLKARYEAHAIALTHGFKNPNEVRAIENDNSYPGGNVFRSQMNMEPASGGEKSKEPDEPDDDADDDADSLANLQTRMQAMVDEHLEGLAKQLVAETKAVDVHLTEAFTGAMTTFASETTGAATRQSKRIDDHVSAALETFKERSTVIESQATAAITTSVDTIRSTTIESLADWSIPWRAACVRDVTDRAEIAIDELVHNAKGKATIVALLGLEINRVMHAARTSKNFCGFLDRFYDDWPGKVADRLSAYAVDVEAFDAWAVESKEACLEIAGEVTDSAKLEEALSPVVTMWSERAEGLCAGILKKEK
ncbi:hypothetical protein LCGC14_2487890, partial [marine sediment metagenome]